jgi:glycosyltransferase involved in cell wall biosynthesis/GT2 family glycosyltransferase
MTSPLRFLNTARSAERPRLSVIIPCHDDGDYLIEAVASVQQNAPEAELIIVDDGSTQPRTREVLAALGEAGHRVIEQPHGGLPAARNTGIAASAGDYFLPLDADNRLLPGFAAEAVALLDADPAAGVVYGDRREFGTRSGDVTVPEFDLPRMLSGNYIDACAVVRREVWSEGGGYDAALDTWEDWDFWLGAAARGWRFVRIPRPTFEYRIRPDSLHHRFLRRTDYLPALRRVYEKYPQLVSEHAVETLLAVHVERRQLRDDALALRDARDVLQVEIDRLALGTQEILAARDAELASVKSVLEARDEQPSALRNLQFDDAAELTEATVVFTIVARNYLAYARVLAASLARHNPNTRLQVVLLDDPDHSIHSEPSFEIIHADELPFDPPSELYTMAAIYDVTELATAVKPWAFEHLFARGAPVVLYLDPDIEVFHPLGPLEPLTLAHGMVLTPHVTEPLPQDGKRPEDRDFLLSGMYNLGFLALSAEAAGTFLPWWRGRLRRDCLNDTTRGLFVDQRWIDFAPALFAPAILKDPGYNVAYWNLPHRALTVAGDRLLVNGRPLRFFHYSGFSPRTPHLLSKHQHASPRVRLSETPLLGDLCRRYAAALEEAGFAECDALHYGFATTATHLPLDARARRVLRRTYIEDEAREGAVSFPNPFSRAGADDVIQRLMRPSPHAPQVPAYLGEIWSERPDLRVAFHHIASVDAERFLDWVRTQGVREHQIHPQLIPPPAMLTPGPAMPRLRSEPLTPGVNVYGYVYSESGTGQIVRAVVAALAAEGIPYAVVPFTRTISRQEREFHDLGAAEPAFDTNLICVNADPLPLFFEDMRGQLPVEARNIGLWAWEVEDLPEAMGRSESYLDEVWGISSFTAEALSRSLTKPVRAFPLPVVVPEVRPRTRAGLGMPEGFLFLFSFDYDSVFRRKNPLAVVAAFRQAFADDPEVVLYIKTTNAERHGAEDEELRAAAAGRSNIVIRDGYVSSDDYFSMLDACDCYVSLHRSEGFGLTVAEAMALGKPVISTAYSSTLEFANESNSFLVPARLTEVGDHAPPYPPRSHWAEPDVAAAAQQMARVYADPGAAAAVGARARADIQALHSPSARGPLLRRLLEEHRDPPKEVDTEDEQEMQEEQPASAPAEVTVELPDPFGVNAFEMDAISAESLLGSPRPDLPSPMQRLVTPLRRLVLRCIRVYWVQQLAIHRALLTAMRTLRRESRAESASQAALLVQQREAQEQTGAETARMREDLTALAADIRALRERIAAMTTTSAPAARQTVVSDDEQLVRRETDR